MAFENDFQNEVLSASGQSANQSSTNVGHRLEITEPDDQFPGSFFRIPGMPKPGKTTWSLSE